PDGTRLLLSDSKGRACLWVLAEEKTSWHAPFAPCAFSPDGATVVGNGDGWHVWDATTGKPCGKLNRRNDDFGRVQALAYSPGGQRIAVGLEDATVYLCPTKTVRAITHFKAAEALKALKAPVLGAILRAQGEGAAVHTLAFSPDGRWLCTSGVDGSGRLW